MASAIFRALLFVTAVVSVSLAAPPSDVVVLDTDNFDRMTKEGVWFIKFYAPWCGHCKRMAPIWEQLAKRLLETGIRVGKVDADGETEIGERFTIQHYPTLKIFEGGKATDYKGGTDMDSMHKFALEYKAKPRAQATTSSKPFNFAAAFKNIDTNHLAGPALAIVEKLAGDSLGLYSFAIFLLGFFAGILAGIMFAVREKATLIDSHRTRSCSCVTSLIPTGLVHVPQDSFMFMCDITY
eukprot:CAMPEP_0179452280 /NCGR_PEP_ID=MMETSP0799-20121207/36177_1 /TAXON_ID=46947 /ORGANISM="Geminigera cryophila, Strain CCMP2564" /LENGTH=238 /DNA_ID=CAMNT_0021248067 /DNA_START=971 /DNA_END=1688 /DNA_ORIENTATION=+